MEETVEELNSLVLLAEKVLTAYLKRLASSCEGDGTEQVKENLSLYDDMLCMVQGVRDLENGGYQSDYDDDDDE